MEKPCMHACHSPHVFPSPPILYRLPLQRVVLDRSVGKLGLSIVGGADHVSRVFGQGTPGLYVSKVN